MLNAPIKRWLIRLNFLMLYAIYKRDVDKELKDKKDRICKH